jgi:cysteine desulfurase
MRVYFDHNASSPLRPSAKAAMVDVLDSFGNPSSVHAEGRAARKHIEDARRQIANAFDVESKAVLFTSGATEAANHLLSPYWKYGKDDITFDRLIISDIEHPCVHEGGFFDEDAVIKVPVTADGMVDVNALQSVLETCAQKQLNCLVSVMAANNETGILQPLDAIASLCNEFDATFVIDAVQIIGRFPFDVNGLDFDALFFSSHKLGGPKGAGAILLKHESFAPLPLLRGGGQERKQRAGTENALSIAGFGMAVHDAVSDSLSEMTRVSALRDTLEKALQSIDPGCVIVGNKAPRLCNTSMIMQSFMPAETLLIMLDLNGLSLSSGSACSSGKVQSSHVLKAMGVDKAQASGAIRISLGWSTTEDEVTKAIEIFKTVLSQPAKQSAVA